MNQLERARDAEVHLSSTGTWRGERGSLCAIHRPWGSYRADELCPVQQRAVSAGEALKRTYEELERRIGGVGLAARGGLRPEPSDGLTALEGGPVRTLILIGLTGAQQWRTFADSAEYGDGLPNPLDRWSKRIIDELAGELGARALYPFGGPPWWPFQRWARRALALHVSPLRVLIDPEFGLWHSYRGALALSIDVELPPPEPWPHPCEHCESKACLHSCPVGAVRQGAFAFDDCRRHVRTIESGCRSAGCLARRACPIGAEHAYLPAQASFHMRSFVQTTVPE